MDATAAHINKLTTKQLMLLVYINILLVSGGVHEFSFGGYSPGGLEDFRLPRPEAEAVSRHCLQMLTAEMIKI